MSNCRLIAVCEDDDHGDYDILDYIAVPVSISVEDIREECDKVMSDKKVTFTDTHRIFKVCTDIKSIMNTVALL